MQLPELGETGQQKLTDAKVIVIGVGGLGCAVLSYLASSGVGHLGLVDGDKIEKSNLHRQILFSESEIGQLKSVCAARRLRQMNTKIEITPFGQYLDSENAKQLLKPYDIVVDATDRLSERYLINDICVKMNKPFVYGSVYRYEGQVSVFNYQKGPTYRCVFGNGGTRLADREHTGILPTTVGMIGLLQANEVLKIILNIGKVLSGKLLLINVLTNERTIFKCERKIPSDNN